MPRRGYPPELRRRALELIASGRKVVDVARDLGISDQTLYTWRRQERIDRGETPGLNSVEQAELTASRRRIRELEVEVAELLKERTDQRPGRGDPVDGRGGSPSAGRVPDSRGLRGGLSRLAEPAALRSINMLCVAHRCHRGRPQRFTRDLRCTPGPR